MKAVGAGNIEKGMGENLKNKKWAVIITAVFLLMFQTFLLAACSHTEVTDQESNDESVMIEEEENDQDTEPAGEEDMGNSLSEDGGTGDVYEMEESLLTQEEAEALTDPLLQWAGLYLIGSLEQRDAFDDTMKTQMAGITLAYGYLPEISSEIMMADQVAGISYEAPEGYLYVSPENLRAAEKFFFGETVDINDLYQPEKAGEMCLNDGEGGMLVWAGDWGITGPSGEIASIENMGGILNMVTVSYGMYDSEEDMIVEELGWIEYLVQGTEESGETPKIIDVNIQSLYVDEEAYLYENWKDNAIVWESDDFSLELPEAWEERGHIYQDNGAYNFICSAAASENYMGVLFTIVRIQKGVAVEIPDYQMLEENDSGVYIAMFPTDVQFDPDDSYAAGEYMDMSRYTDEILSTFQLQ